MKSLPAFAAGDLLFRLPLLADTADALAALFVAPDAMEVDRLINLVARDPALALWIVCQGQRRAGPAMRTPTVLAIWLKAHARRVFAAADRSANGVQYCAAKFQQLLTASRSAADRAASEDAESQLLALLHCASDWLRLASTADAFDQQLLAVLPNWLAEALAARKNVTTSKGTAARLATDEAAAIDHDALAKPSRLSLVLLARRIERLAELESELERNCEREKLEALAEFAAGAGHEINNPVAVISGRAQLLLAAERQPERRQDLAVIHAQARRIHEMIVDLMLFARPPRPEFREVDLRVVIDQVVERLRPTIEHRVELLVEPGDEELWISADPSQLGVALGAVVENAIAAVGDTGRIIISAGREEYGEVAPGVAIQIRDNGPGIGDEVRRHLFDPFFSGRSAGRGIGMGLAKCWRIVQLHGGAIGVESSPPGGSVFTIRLPGLGKQSITANGDTLYAQSLKLPGADVVGSEDRTG